MNTCPNCGYSEKKKVPPDPRIKNFINLFFEMYKVTFKEPPDILGARDAAVIKRLLKKRDIHTLLSEVGPYFRTDDTFFKKNGYDIPRFEKFIAGQITGGYYGNGRMAYKIDAQAEKFMAILKDSSIKVLPAKTEVGDELYRAFYLIGKPFSELKEKAIAMPKETKDSIIKALSGSVPYSDNQMKAAGDE